MLQEDLTPTGLIVRQTDGVEEVGIVCRPRSGGNEVDGFIDLDGGLSV